MYINPVMPVLLTRNQNCRKVNFQGDKIEGVEYNQKVGVSIYHGGVLEEVVKNITGREIQTSDPNSRFCPTGSAAAYGLSKEEAKDVEDALRKRRVIPKYIG